MFSQKNIIVWVVVLLIFIFWFRKRYLNCTNLWSKLDTDAEQIFFEHSNKVDNNPALKQEIEKKAIDNERSYESQKVYYASQYLVDKGFTTDLERRNIIKCLA